MTATLADNPAARPASRLDRLLAWRDACLANPRFQRWAAAFPLTRPIARRRARDLFDLCAGFVYSQVLAACVRLRVFDLLAAGPQDARTLAARLALSPESAERLLDAAVALRLLERRSASRYGLGPLGTPLVGNAALAAMIEHHEILYGDLRDPVALLRGTGDTDLAEYWAYARSVDPAMLPPLRYAAYSTLMSASQTLVAGQVLDAYPIRQHRCLLDVGGGEGTFLAAAAAYAPRLRLILFDLPAVAERAAARLAAARLSERASTFGGNFFTDPLPAGADVVSLVRVIHDHDDEEAMQILRATRRALPPRGTLLLAEPMAEAPGAGRVGDAYFGWYLLAMGRGKPRAPRRLIEMLAAAGYDEARVVPTHMPLQTGLIVARAAEQAG
jgi:demethylspheroidene O-methyltransferase